MDLNPPPLRHDSFAAYRALAECWALRVAVQYFGWGGHDPFGVIAAVARILNSLECSIPADAAQRAEFWKRAAEHLRAREAAPRPSSAPLFRNARLLREHLALSAPEEDVLLVCVMAQIHGPLREVLSSIDGCDDARLAEVLGAALARPPDEILEAIEPRSTLVSSELIRVLRVVANPIERLSPLPGLCGLLTRSYSGFEDLFAAFAREAPAPSLGREDYAHIEGALELLVSYLRAASGKKSKGRNVLLYGVPGTGKTELARLACRLAGLRLFEAEVSHADGEPLGVKGRLQAAAFLQRLVAPLPESAVLVDEAEDVFRPQEGPEPEGRGMSAADSKGWTVRFFESNPVPTIWISNRVTQIDRAVLRRFDLALEVPLPPLDVRRRILERCLGGRRAIGACVDRILRELAPAPAIFSRAVSVLSLVRCEDDDHAARTLEQIVRGSLAAMGYRLDAPAKAESETFYPGCANNSPGVEEVLAIVRSVRPARVLLYGPSGSGKSACARHLAERLGAPLLALTAKDVALDPEITGFTLRRAFADAHRDGAILLLDQLDWLVHGWTEHPPLLHQKLLDELCTCLDAHDGHVFCATRRTAFLEPAIVRRFPVRVRFDYLKPEQRLELLHKLLGDESAARRLAQKLAGLRALTPGDIVAALGRHRGTASSEPERIFASLAEAERLKADAPAATIGFLGS
ncbi:MAG: ATP-binding protein [Burkholderiales bacterium]|nr:ATP-binding protein [Burkholderiales bacterium]